MLVHLAKPGNRGQIGFVHALTGHFASIGAGRANPGDAAGLEDDLLVGEPGAGMDVQQPPDPERAIGRFPAERHQRQLLADGDLVGAG